MTDIRLQVANCADVNAGESSVMFNRQSIDQAVAVLKQKFSDRLSQNETVRSQHSHTTSRIPQQLPDAVIFAQSAHFNDCAILDFFIFLIAWIRITRLPDYQITRIPGLPIT